jgi:hypothetical protein
MNCQNTAKRQLAVPSPNQLVMYLPYALIYEPFDELLSKSDKNSFETPNAAEPIQVVLASINDHMILTLSKSITCVTMYFEKILINVRF